MRELLEKWAALEPDWCRVDDERASVMADVGTPLERPRFTAQYHRLGQYEPDILASVIEAIEAHGWEWSLWSDGALAEATVTIPGEERRKFEKSGGGEPAVGLLMAHLDALEAEGQP
ncbi:MAG TPA: hypothetical protein VF202_12250 [Trueperaceae bacterium]